MSKPPLRIPPLKVTASPLVGVKTTAVTGPVVP